MSIDRSLRPGRSPGAQTTPGGRLQPGDLAAGSLPSAALLADHDPGARRAGRRDDQHRPVWRGGRQRDLRAPDLSTCPNNGPDPTTGNVMRAVPERRTVAYVACLVLAVVCCACACGSAPAESADGPPSLAPSLPSGHSTSRRACCSPASTPARSRRRASLFASCRTWALATGGPGADERTCPGGAGVLRVGARVRQPGAGVRDVRCHGDRPGPGRVGGWPGAGGGAPVRRAGRQRHRGHRRDRGPLRPAIGRRPGPGGAAAGVRRSARMPGARLLPARAEAGLRAPVPGFRPAGRRGSADAAGPAGRGHRRRAAVQHRSGHHRGSSGGAGR